MKIIVTGAIGHIGSYIIRELPNKFPGSKIIMIDNMMTQRYASLFDLPIKGNYQFIEADVNKIDLNSIIKDAHVLIHLAAITDAAASFEKAEALEKNNFESTKKVAEACVLSGTRLIALSSTSVYGTQNEIVSEDCTVDELKPQSPYATTKLLEEQLVSNLVVNKGLKAIICRFGTIFGASPGMRFHTAVNKFCWQAIMGQPITVWTTAYEQKRPYLDLLDASNAIGFIIEKDLFDGNIYNILTNNLTVSEVVDTIKQFKPELFIKFVDNKIMNQLSYEVSCNKFIEKGFKFTGNLKSGVGETIEMLKTSNNGRR
jgi:UDP-glucose 4-epimerase